MKFALIDDQISAEMQNDSRFIECYHRILLNMDFIKYMDGENFILVDETKIPISQRKSKASKLKYMNHLIKIGSICNSPVHCELE